jgi:hypothetical protein|tara:strand:+ start:2359 stop:3324 length:966 start_codon:yes stop_codon:yes gene_type:complete
MGFISTANTNTLEVSLTDYGKSVLLGNAGGGLMEQVVKFGLRDGDIDYRRFTGDSTTQSYGPCHDQSLSVNPNMVSLSGDCFYNYPDIRGRYGMEVCDLAVLDGPTTDGITILYNPPKTGNLWYSTKQDLESKGCFEKGVDIRRLGLNEYGCKCSQFGIYRDDINDNGGIKPGYPTYTDVVQMFNYVKNPRYFTDDDFKIGDFTGEGEINCDDFCWVVSCYSKGIKETNGGLRGEMTNYDKENFKSMMLSLGCKCEGYIPKPKITQTFRCPANKQIYPLTDRNKRICENLMENLRNKTVSSSNKTNRNTNNNNSTLRAGGY